jgi:hypothetical protein
VVESVLVTLNTTLDLQMDKPAARIIQKWHADRVLQGGIRALRGCGPLAFRSIQSWCRFHGHPLKET